MFELLFLGAFLFVGFLVLKLIFGILGFAFHLVLLPIKLLMGLVLGLLMLPLLLLSLPVLVVGVIGLGLLLPGVFGPALGMAIGITIVRDTGRLLIWSLIGNVIWSILMTSVGALGVTIF